MYEVGGCYLSDINLRNDEIYADARYGERPTHIKQYKVNSRFVMCIEHKKDDYSPLKSTQEGLLIDTL